MADPFGAPLPQQYTYASSNPYGQQAYSQPSWGVYGGRQGGASASTFDEDLPLLEELGIDVGAILRKSRSVLFGRVGADSLKDIDMGGPLIFAGCLAALHLLTGKLHFGVILGWSAVSFTVFWFIVHQLAGHGDESRKECIDLYNCSACLGYCLLPMVVTNAVTLFLPHASAVVPLMFWLVSAYCAWLAGRLVVNRAPFLREQQATIAYPAFLYYLTLALISLY